MNDIPLADCPPPWRSAQQRLHAQLFLDPNVNCQGTSLQAVLESAGVALREGAGRGQIPSVWGSKLSSTGIEIGKCQDTGTLVSEAVRSSLPLGFLEGL